MTLVSGLEAEGKMVSVPEKKTLSHSQSVCCLEEGGGPLGKAAAGRVGQRVAAHPGKQMPVTSAIAIVLRVT